MNEKITINLSASEMSGDTASVPAVCSALSVEEIRQRMGDMATTEQAQRMLDLLVYSAYADTPTADIPEREWLRLLDIACE